MKNITRIMIDQWNMKDVDWLGYKMTRNNPYTFHHIQKREHGGREIISNGAIITKNPHEYIHLIEIKDLEMYIYLNNILKEINNQGYMPIYRQYKAIDSILSQFEREHCSDRTKKGKLLIKEEYTKRLIK